MDLYLSIQATLIYWQKNAEVVDFTSRWCKSIFLVKFSRFFFICETDKHQMQFEQSEIS